MTTVVSATRPAHLRSGMAKPGMRQRVRDKRVRRRVPRNQGEFEALLDKLRPEVGRVETFYEYPHADAVAPEHAGQPIRAKIVVDGKTKSTVDCKPGQSQAVFDSTVQRHIEFFMTEPRLWSGCRHAVARHLGIDPDRSFQTWFDHFADRGK